MNGCFPANGDWVLVYDRNNERAEITARGITVSPVIGWCAEWAGTVLDASPIVPWRYDTTCPCRLLDLGAMADDEARSAAIKRAKSELVRDHNRIAHNLVARDAERRARDVELRAERDAKQTAS